MGVDEKFSAIRKGMLEFLLLKVIAADKVYAADILRQLSGTEFATPEGTLYPLLSKMRREGLLDYEWKESEAGPPRKYYELTAKGRAQLRETSAYWEKISGTVKDLGQSPG
jgi:PadR family transcriptional regulator PadR